ncbi:MAG TPA: ABC transporter ATP-binding protein [Castellaniella sp.]|uniref:ABC transporter ATP-binding protein n=1 Tax=Castellaniella sp. TaxID=1955812 RepID=UPI002EE9B16A
MQHPMDQAVDATPSVAPLLELRGITKRYPGTLANDSVDLQIMPGERHALLGENGAGKSTLVKCIYGVIRPDAGTVHWQGKPVSVTSPSEAQRLGIGMVFQHFSLFETLTVAQNIALSLQHTGSLRQLSERIAAISHEYHLAVQPNQHVHSLSVGERQRVEIVRCLLQGPQLLIMDEPTSVLTPGEVDLLFETLTQFTRDGRSILYISHKLEEVRALCTAATVLRTARLVGRCDPRTESAHGLARMMMGSEPPTLKGRQSAPDHSRPCLQINDLSCRSADPFGTTLEHLNLTVNYGEIVGIAGVAGNGQQELLAALSGERGGLSSDMLRLDGQAIGHLGSAGRRARGLGFAPAERLGRGAVPEMSLSDNTCLTAYQKGLVRRGFVLGGAVRKMAGDICTDFHVVASSIDAEARNLSGGNLQKFVMGREILQTPKILIAANPTWGVDVGASTAIRQALMDLAAAGQTGILLVSEDLHELFEICDRIAVLYEGQLSEIVAVPEADRDAIGRWMAGLPGAAGTVTTKENRAHLA